MQKPLMALMIAGLALSGCGWFGGSRRGDPATTDASVNPLIPEERQGAFQRPDAADTSVPITSVTALRIDRTNTSAIVLATGVANRQGAYEARLVPENEKAEPVDGVLTFTFTVLYPSRATPAGSEFSRTINEGYTLSRKQLESVRVVRVIAANNTLEARR